MPTSPDFLSPWRPWWRVWTAPGLAAWAVVCALLQLAARLPFARLPLVPFAVPFDPSAAFVPFWIIAFGPAGLAGCLAAQVAGDVLDGLPGAATGCRAAGLLLGGTWLMQVSRRGMPREPGEAWQPPKAGRVFLTGLPLSLTLAAWTGVGLEWAGWYPLVYTGPLAGLHHLLLTGLLGAPLAPVVLRLLEGRFGSWMETVRTPPGWMPADRGRTLWFCGMLVVALVTVTAISWFKYGLGPLQPTVLGVHGGKPVPAAATLLLLVQAMALCWPDRLAGGGSPATPAGVWRAAPPGGGLTPR